ncbi:uncharacterized protein FIBRA_06118 [Fibroporia radiculosa]|uniref:HMG box domain-containing protein n=1 Tax=Fibroporia radiculosa TaxID=599839 RepID=J4HYL7_9APHY|nr:uncharacterized protein FIBRA_06118 [Fibroporia radiculosa]CCM03962.1 predicted protein [Fibroporia radiculosa]
MANVPEGIAHFEFQKMQLMNGLGAVAEQLRNCASFADQFAQVVSHVQYGGAAAVGQFVMPPGGIPAQVVGGKRKSRIKVDADGRRIRTPRKLKDPNAPKRPASSYLIFQNDVRQKLKEEHPGIANNELLTMIAKLWGEMPKEKKEQYEARQKVMKDQWLVDKAQYEIGGSPDTAVPVVVAEPAIVAAAKPDKVAAESSDESEEEEEGTSTPESSSGDEDDEEEEQPPPKRSKKESGSPSKVVQTPKKQKKSKA